MEQKHEPAEEQLNPKPGLWLPWLNLKDGDTAAPLMEATATPVEKEETTDAAMLPSHMIAPPVYYAPTELNLQLAQMGRETPLREAGLIGMWACLVPLLSIWFLVSLFNPYPGSGISVVGSGLLLAFLFHYNRLIDSLSQSRAALSLSEFGKEWTGGFIEALFWPNTRIQNIATTVLTHLLPRLTREDASQLTFQQREILYTRLYTTRSKPDFQIAILKALAVVGDEHSIPHMERLTGSIAWTPRQARVRTAAREALTLLEERLAQQRKALSPEGEEEIKTVPAETEEIVQAEPQVRSQDAEELLKKMEEASKNRRPPAMRIGFLIANLFIIAPYLVYQALTHLTAHAYGTSLIWAVLCVVSTQLYRLTLSPGMSEAARKLANSDDIRAVGTLADALEWPDSDIQKAARSGLTRLLPQLRATDANLLNPKQRHILYKSLKMNNYKHWIPGDAAKDLALIETILKALEQVGDKEAIPYVERLMQNRSNNPRDISIRQKAEQCYPYLLRQAETNESSKMLLRASSATEMSPEILLRPASPNQGEAAEELLRPSTHDLP